MSNNNEQNGRQPPLPQQTASTATAVIHKNIKSSAPTDPRIRSASVTTTATEQQIKKCRDFVWGICTKGAQCKFRHELDVESMKDILKFCHDFQNRTGCTRPDCTYLHTSREEENLFLTTGQIPRALAERYAAMSTSQMNMYVNKYLVQAPPPPPPPPPPPSAAAPPPPLPAPLPAPLPTLLAPPPPPPPPTTTSAPVRMTPPLFSAPPPFNNPAMFPLNQPPPPLPPMFDASRPPPPLPANATPNKNGAIKRTAGPCEAGPSKARKAECSKVVDTVCENCIQREIRIELFRQELQKLECEAEYQSYIHDKKSTENANGRLLLKSSVSPELFRILDEYIEGSVPQPQVQDMLPQYSQSPTFISETSTVPRQFLLQLITSVLKQRTVVEPPPVANVGVDEASLLHSLTALTRRANPISHTSTDVIQAVLEVFRNSSNLNSDRSQGNESRAKDTINSDRNRPTTSNINSSAVNGFSHFVNGHKAESGPPVVVASSSRYPTTTNVAVRTYSSGTSSGTASLTQSAAHLPTAAHPVSATHPAVAPRLQSATHPQSAPQPPSAPHSLAVRAAAAPPAYMPYQAVVPPPPNRTYYPQPYPTTSNHVPNIHQAYPNSPRGAVTPQVPARPSTSAATAPVQNAQVYNPYLMGRYPPQPHNYPPFQ